MQLALLLPLRNAVPIKTIMTTHAQETFDNKYITSTEIIRELKINRTTLLFARRTGKLPEPIVVNDGRLYIWERASIQEYLSAWRVMLNAKRNGG